MVAYQGGKRHGLGGGVRACDAIVSAIVGRHARIGRWVEPFVGGGNVAEAAATHCDSMLLGDVRADVVMMLRDVVSGAWSPPSADEVSRERYCELKSQTWPSAERGFYGTAMSFGGKWFGGFNGELGRRDGYVSEARHSLARLAETLRGKPIEWNVGVSYERTRVEAGDVVYCDPPYTNTAGYSRNKFDSRAFWRWARAMHERGAHVYVSEYRCPRGWVPVWSSPKWLSLRGNGNSEQRRETLYTCATSS